MNEAQVVDEDRRWGGEPALYCACLQRLTIDDIDKGFHLACGRAVKVVLGEPPS